MEEYRYRADIVWDTSIGTSISQSEKDDWTFWKVMLLEEPSKEVQFIHGPVLVLFRKIEQE